MKFSCIPTCIGSFPHKEPAEICSLLADCLQDMPVWPQLPGMGFKESMYVQFSNRMPCLIIEEEKQRIYFETQGNVLEQVEDLYLHVLEDNIEYFGFKEEYAHGFYRMIQEINSHKPKYFKGQVTGPVSFGLLITDENRKAIIYNDILFDAVVKCLAMNAKWQVEKIKATGACPVIFIDEPYLSSFGSAYINITREQVVSLLDEMAQAIHERGGIAGVHCCGNTDWSILMDTKVDIINFDAYEYFQGMTLYPEKLRTFMKTGGSLAIGIVPTGDTIEGETPEHLYELLMERVNIIASKLRGAGSEDIFDSALLTPGCGTGTMKSEKAELVLKTLKELGELVKLRRTGT